MKLSLFILFTISFTLLNSQIKQSEFDNMLAETKELISSFKYANYENLESNLNIHKDEIENRIGGILTESSIDFNGLNQHKYLFPVYRETEMENTLELTIIGSEIQEKRKGETYSRAKYYFVVKAGIEYDTEKEKVVFKNAKLITAESEIQKWWLGQYADYMVETRKIMDRFGYKMPPPAPPPLNLK